MWANYNNKTKERSGGGIKRKTVFRCLSIGLMQNVRGGLSRVGRDPSRTRKKNPKNIPPPVPIVGFNRLANSSVDLNKFKIVRGKPATTRPPSFCVLQMRTRNLFTFAKKRDGNITLLGHCRLDPRNRGESRKIAFYNQIQWPESAIKDGRN
jgi:hypothetical protein